jgi:hypothetical protein
MLTGGRLGMHQFAIDRDFVPPAGRREQHNPSDAGTEGSE